MTLSVPYSFVPGAKAKAEEVNANFASILDKIEETNTKLDDSIQAQNTTFNEQLEQKADLALSNLNTEGKAIIDAKANNTDIDGKWTFKYKTVAENISLRGTTNLTYSLTSYLPSDSNLYEIIVEGLVDTGTTSGDYAPLYLSTDLLTNSISICRARTRTASLMNSSGTSTIIVGKGRKITINRSSSWNGLFNIYLHGYRKVR